MDEARQRDRRILRLAAIALVAVCAVGGLERARATNLQTDGAAETASGASALVDEGLAALDRGDAATARDRFERALASDPKSSGAHTGLGILADAEGRLDDAAAHFARAAELAPSARTHNNYGVVLVRLGRAAEAAREFEASLALDARQPSALVNLAQIRFAAGSPDDLREAESLLARACAIAPDAAIARGRTIVALRLGEPAAAAARYGEYAKLIEGAPLGAIPAKMRADLGAALREAGLLTEAESELEGAVAADPADATSVVQLALVKRAKKDLPGAGRTLEAAVARGVDAAPVYALLAKVYEETNHIENAIPAMRLAIDRDRTSEEYRFAYGMLLMNAYAPAAAEIRLQEALKDFPDSPRLWFALGLAYFKHDRDDEAVAALDRALALDPKFAPATAYLGMVKTKTGDYAEAVKRFESALAIDPKLTIVHYLIAETLVKSADAENAEIRAHLEKAIAADPSFVPARVALARVLIREENWTGAAAELERAVALDPNATEAYYHLGRVYARLKRSDDARAAAATFERLSATQKEREHDELTDVVRRLANVYF
jgi:Tfp pilus assembly protein PilF